MYVSCIASVYVCLPLGPVFLEPRKHGRVGGGRRAHVEHPGGYMLGELEQSRHEGHEGQQRIVSLGGRARAEGGIHTRERALERSREWQECERKNRQECEGQNLEAEESSAREELLQKVPNLVDRGQARIRTHIPERGQSRRVCWRNRRRTRASPSALRWAGRPGGEGVGEGEGDICRQCVLGEACRNTV